MKQATASYMKFSKELTKYSVNVAVIYRGCISSMSMRKKVEYARRNAFQHKTKI